MSSQTKGITKLLAAIVIVIIVVAAVAAWQAPSLFSQPATSPSPSPSANPSSSPAVTLPEMTLTVIGANGDQVVLHADDIAALDAYTENAGYKSSGGYIAAVGSYTGVPILTLCDLVGGITSTQTLTITASDGYSMVYTYDQANGNGFTTYDPVTGSEKEATQPMTMTANYLMDGAVLPSEQGPLRIGVLGPEGLLTEGHFWTKMVSKIEVTNNVRDWTVTVDSTGDTEPYSMDRQDWTADYNHFTLEWTDDNGNVWAGTALWRWVSWYNYNGGISNDTLDQGYSVKIISGDGYSATLEDTSVWLNDNIIVAGTLNGAVLSEPYWPLTIVGSDVTGQQKVKNIVEIQIVLNPSASSSASPSPSSSPAAPTTPTVTTTPAPTVAPTATPSPTATANPTSNPTAAPTATPSPSAAPSQYDLLITGTEQVTMSSTEFEAEVSQVSSSYTDSKDNVWTGTTLYRLVYWATTNGAITDAAISDGYVAKVIASDGTVLALNDSRVKENKDIFIANLVNGEAIDADSGPLRLTGDDLGGGKERLKCITEIQIIPMNRNITLTVTAANGTSVTLFANDLASIESITANGGTRSSSGKLSNYGAYTGVSMLTLLQPFGLTSSNTIKVTASDGYATTYTYGALSGEGAVAYDSSGNQVTASSLTMILGYQLDGASLAVDPGPLRSILVGPDGYYTTGSMSAKMVVAIEII
ncbi:MAG: hypothetical protein NWF05_10530 [Candidatus Bathyarchaeota archaeon]|nr:hypothetical protein [Candidatus Bathyarchaeota archaeon]